MGRKESLIKRLAAFKTRLSEKMPVEKIIFFGSHARGRAHKWSDVDLIVVSKKFRGKRFRYRPLGFHRLWDIRYPVDFLCYTPEEFQKLRKQSAIVRDAEREGIEI
ncbi:MAG: nucleotidyltransferase domain-containing protein [Nitrospinota bacterium]